MERMKKEDYTKEALLDVIGSYLRQISRDGGMYPTAVLSDLEVSMKYILRVNEYNGKYKDELNR